MAGTDARAGYMQSAIICFLLQGEIEFLLLNI